MCVHPLTRAPHANHSAEDVIVNWLVDDGVADRGHRHNLLRGCWHACGVAIGPHPGPVHFKVVAVFASAYEPKSADGDALNSEEVEDAAGDEFKSAGDVVPADAVFAAINRFRSDPSSFVEKLQARRDCIDHMKVMHLPDTLPLMVRTHSLCGGRTIAARPRVSGGHRGQFRFPTDARRARGG